MKKKSNNKANFLYLKSVAIVKKEILSEIVNNFFPLSSSLRYVKKEQKQTVFLKLC